MRIEDEMQSAVSLRLRTMWINQSG